MLLLNYPLSLQAPVHVKAFLDMSRSGSHCDVFCHALHALQYATNKHLSINRRFVFIGKIPTVKGQKIKSGYKQLLGEVFCDIQNRRFHGRGRHLGSGANAAKFTLNVWEKS